MAGDGWLTTVLTVTSYFGQNNWKPESTDAKNHLSPASRGSLETSDTVSAISNGITVVTILLPPLNLSSISLIVIDDSSKVLLGDPGICQYISLPLFARITTHTKRQLHCNIWKTINCTRLKQSHYQKHDVQCLTWVWALLVQLRALRQLSYLLQWLQSGNSFWHAQCRTEWDNETGPELSNFQQQSSQQHVSDFLFSETKITIDWSIMKGHPEYLQDAQLSQRDRAAGCVIVFAKSGRLELGDNILRTL